MKTIVALWTVVLTAVGGWLFWRNTKSYASKSRLWVLGKTAIEVFTLFVTATLMPALLIVWLVVWVTSPIKTPWIRTFVGVLSGVCFGFLSSFALEALIFFGIFAIDMKTGAHCDGGFLNCWKRANDPVSNVVA